MISDDKYYLEMNITSRLILFSVDYIHMEMWQVMRICIICLCCWYKLKHHLCLGLYSAFLLSKTKIAACFISFAIFFSSTLTYFFHNTFVCITNLVHPNLAINLISYIGGYYEPINIKSPKKKPRVRWHRLLMSIDHNE